MALEGATSSSGVPKEVLDLHEKGIEAIRRQNYDYAIELLTSALALKQDFAEARLYLWLALWEKQKRTSDPLKIKIITKKIASFILVLKGLSLQKQGKNWEAIYQYEKAMKADAGNTQILNAMAECFLSEGQTLNAIKVLEAIPQINPKNNKAMNRIGQLYMKLENYEKARAYFQAALRANPSDMEAEHQMKNLDAIKTMKKGFDNQ